MHILAVGAHPDDIELGCGGTLAKLISKGSSVRAVILTDGVKGKNELFHSDRHRETYAALSDIGVVDIHLEYLTDTRLPGELNQLVDILTHHIREHQPDRLYTMFSHDRHQDHRAVYDATLIAGRSVRQILSYETPSSWPNFNPVVFEEIGEWLDLKVQALRRHVSQKHRDYMQEDQVRARAIFRGGQVGVGPSEGFEIYKMVA